MKCYIKNYPRPQFVRVNTENPDKSWESLNGIWDFAFDDSNLGEAQKWYLDFKGDLKIRVPFTYETKLSGIQEEQIHENIWYHRTIHVNGSLLKTYRCILHFEGSDFITKLWVNGQYAGSHCGGYARFSFDITDLVRDGENDLTVKVEDSSDLEQPRGKQRFLNENFSVFYVQTTGIWKTVWTEYVPRVSLAQIKMTPHLQTASLELEAHIDAPSDWLQEKDLFLETAITYEGHFVNKTCTALTHSHVRLHLDLHAEISRMEELAVKTWSPQSPQLYDIEFRILKAEKTPDPEQITQHGQRMESGQVLKSEQVLDQVDSYFAMREIRIEGPRILLNGQPLYQRLLLDQGYWRDSLLTPPDEEALIRDIDSILALGYNGVRKHQKIEDERFLYWCDVKGLLVWSEAPAAFSYSDEAAAEFTREWLEIVKQNYNHPCIITWTPFNESWGIPQIKRCKVQQHFTEAIYYLTKSMDPYRPVITNDGWEHTVSDIITLHDYDQNGAAIRQKFLAHKEEILSANTTPYLQRSAFAEGYAYQGQPVIISEYGGIAIDTGVPGWGNFVSEEEFLPRFDSITTAIKDIPYICGYCYTQAADVQQETNGMMDMERNFKIDPTIIQAINRR